MNETYRHQNLLSLLEEKKILSTTEIIDLLEISPATARRDINKLNEQGRLRKVRNGAEALSVNFGVAKKKIIIMPTKNSALQRLLASIVMMVKASFSPQDQPCKCWATVYVVGICKSSRISYRLQMI